MQTHEIIFQNVTGVILTIGAVALLMIFIGGAGFWLLHRMECRRRREKLLDMHDEIWDGSASTELYCWLKIRWDLEQKNATTPVKDELEKLIRECMRRHQQYRNIMLETGRPIRVRKTENEGGSL